MASSAAGNSASKDSEQMVVDTFKKFDLNGDGKISKDELTKVLKALDPVYFTDAATDIVLKEADTNGDGKIQYEEFVAWVMSEAKKSREAVKSGVNVQYRCLLPQRFDVDIKQRYDVDKLTLGEGGYGKVFIASDSQYQNRKVVVKMVTKTTTKGSSKNADGQDALESEIRIMKDLDHPNICRLFETFEQGNSMFFVMEYCEGGEVFDRIVSDGGIGESSTAQIVKQTASALRYAHDRGIAHRDVKPENLVFVSKDKADTQVKLIDWGLGISFLDTPMKAAVGSFTYAAPEVVTSRDRSVYSSACDIWSLGVVTYVMLSGKPPFWGSEAQHLKNARAEKFPITGPPWDNISNEAKDFIKLMLKAKPTDRPNIAQVCDHRWLVIKAKSAAAADSTMADVLKNAKHFRDTSIFQATCMAAVSRQLAHKDLKGIHSVFRTMDKNGDGVLSVDEVSSGFESIFGKDSEDYQTITDTFRALDMDGSGVLDYTEFCAAGMGERMSTQEESVWAAFKSFDRDMNGSISQEELLQILGDTDVKKVWTEAVCNDVVKLLSEFDTDKSGAIEFEEYMQMMRNSWAKQHVPAGEDEATDELKVDGTQSITASRGAAKKGSQVYDYLRTLSTQ